MSDPDRVFAARYFDEWILPGIDDLPADGIAHLREHYIADVLANEEALRQLRYLSAESEGRFPPGLD